MVAPFRAHPPADSPPCATGAAEHRFIDVALSAQRSCAECGQPYPAWNGARRPAPAGRSTRVAEPA